MKSHFINTLDDKSGQKTKQSKLAR